MKQILTLVLALVVLGLMSISCQSKSSVESEKRLTASEHSVKLRASLVDHNDLVLVNVEDQRTADYYRTGDTIWVLIQPNEVSLYKANSNITPELVNELKVADKLKLAIIK